MNSQFLYFQRFVYLAFNIKASVLVRISFENAAMKLSESGEGFTQATPNDEF